MDEIKIFETKNELTWCPKCPDYLIKESVKMAMAKIMKSGVKKTDFAMVTDVGCNSKIFDYVNISGFYGLHGRAIPTAFGVHVGNPKMKVLCFSGDGGCFNEGLTHFIYACRYNADMTLLIFNNQIFSLTTGQATATTPNKTVTKTHPKGVQEKPMNPLIMALESGATFVARASSLDFKETAKIIEQAILHPGFSVVDILQPCIIYRDNSEFIKKNNYKVNPQSVLKAISEARKWDYSESGKVGLGIFHQRSEPTFMEKYG
jgi:2-oxoglutarate/2-oxoacid ferredoxin oxidoreductase subunit beta